MEKRTHQESSLYLDTVDRSKLDFDFEKVCSVSLSPTNVYCCLVCGRYFQGRGKSSHAYFHSINDDHHVFLNMETYEVYVLPEGYKETSRDLDDIKSVANPVYEESQINRLDVDKTSYTLTNKVYRPGYIGINNIKHSDYANVVVQLLSHTKPLRNYLLLHPKSESAIVSALSQISRRIWNPRAFKNHVSPHELVNLAEKLSQGKFSANFQADPCQFLVWLLVQTHLGLGGSSKPGSSLIHHIFQGKLNKTTEKLSEQEVSGKSVFDVKSSKTTCIPFLLLTLDLPAESVFKDGDNDTTLEHVPLTRLLKKYDGVTCEELAGERNTYQIVSLPKYLILHYKRFSTLPDGTKEYNGTIVNFPLKGLDMAPYTKGLEGKYNLITNITCEGGDKKDKEWSVQMRDGGRKTWVDVRDLVVSDVTELGQDSLYLKEVYIQVWKRVN